MSRSWDDLCEDLRDDDDCDCKKGRRDRDCNDRKDHDCNGCGDRKGHDDCNGRDDCDQKRRRRPNCNCDCCARRRKKDRFLGIGRITIDCTPVVFRTNQCKCPHR